MCKTVPLLGKADPRFLRLTGYVFIPVEYDLSRQGRVTADFNGHLAPVGIQDRKGIMIQIRQGLVPFQRMLRSTSLPLGSWRFPHQDQKYSPRDGGGEAPPPDGAFAGRLGNRSGETRLALAQPQIRRLNRPAQRSAGCGPKSRRSRSGSATTRGSLRPCVRGGNSHSEQFDLRSRSCPSIDPSTVHSSHLP